MEVKKKKKNATWGFLHKMFRKRNRETAKFDERSKHRTGRTGWWAECGQWKRPATFARFRGFPVEIRTTITRGIRSAVAFGSAFNTRKKTRQGSDGACVSASSPRRAYLEQAALHGFHGNIVVLNRLVRAIRAVPAFTGGRCLRNAWSPAHSLHESNFVGEPRRSRSLSSKMFAL